MMQLISLYIRRQKLSRVAVHAAALSLRLKGSFTPLAVYLSSDHHELQPQLWMAKQCRTLSDFVVRTWHDAREAFDSPRALRLKLMESFPNDLPDHINFQLGYFEGRGSTKRWIVESPDLQSMYSDFEAGAKITLWCEGNPVTSNDTESSSAKEAKQSATDGEPLPAKKAKQSVTGTSKCESFEEEIDQISLN